MSDPIQIDIKGADKIVAALNKFPQEIQKNFKAAGQEAATEIIMTEGLKVYPSKTAANAPPTPYYIRGTGTQLKSRNMGNSEDYKAQFYAKHTPGGTIISNRASYAKYLAGEEDQARVMAKYGWRKLIDVAREKLTAITTIFNKWAQYTIDKLGL
jgi:hypothetical protein